jgi:hypothetical protein
MSRIEENVKTSTKFIRNSQARKNIDFGCDTNERVIYREEGFIGRRQIPQNKSFQ